MNWIEIVKLAAAFIVSIGSAGAIIAGVIKFCADKIAERLSVKYEHELDIKMEQYKSILDKRNYVSKARFDTEFTLCREIMQACKKMIDDVYYVYPPYAKYPADEEMRKKFEMEVYDKAVESYNTFIKLLSGNAPFISEPIYEALSELGKMCHENIDVFSYRWDKGYMGNWEKSEDKKKVESKAYNNTMQMNEKYKSIVKQLRKYFAELDIKE